MRTSIAALVITVSLLAGGGSAEAQVVRGGLFGPRTFVGPGGPVALTPGYGYAYSSGYSVPYSASYVGPGAYPAVEIKPYSYYVLPATVPSREYVGSSDFPFYGRPYGHPYDRWTWPYMSGGYYNLLARYYYPPLGF